MLLRGGFNIFTFWVGKHVVFNFWIFRASTHCSSCLIKPKSNGYKRDVVNTSIEFHLFEVINSYYFLCNLFSSYGGL